MSQVIDYDLSKSLIEVAKLTGGTDKLTHGFLPLYQEHFAKLRQKTNARILELGVWQAASICMWRSYFHPSAYVHAIDFHPYWIPANVGFSLMDTRNKDQLTTFARQMPMWDVVIDDAGHDMQSQQLALQVLWDAIVPGGCFVMEDLHSSFMPQFAPDNKNHLHTTYQLVYCLQHNLDFESPWMSASTFQAIKKQVEKVDILHVNSGMHPYVLSITSVIVKRK